MLIRKILLGVGLVILGIALIQGIFLIEKGYLSTHVLAPAKMTLPEWLGGYWRYYTAGMATGMAISMIWFLCAATLKIEQWIKSDKRWLWLLLLIPLAAISIPPGIIYILDKTPQEGWLMPVLFFTVNPFLLYYILTLFFTPASFKHITPGAYLVRR